MKPYECCKRCVYRGYDGTSLPCDRCDDGRLFQEDPGSPACIHAAALAAKGAELIKLAEDYIQFVWRFRPDCWRTLGELEALISKLTSVPEKQVSKKWADKAPPREPAMRERAQMKDAEIERLKLELHDEKAVAKLANRQAEERIAELGAEIESLRAILNPDDAMIALANESDGRIILAKDQRIAELEGRENNAAQQAFELDIENKSLRDELAAYRDAHEALAGLERLGARWKLRYSEEAKKWVCIAPFEHCGERFYWDNTALAAVRAAEEAGK